jgi:hypothetical protein
VRVARLACKATASEWGWARTADASPPGVVNAPTACKATDRLVRRPGGKGECCAAARAVNTPPATSAREEMVADNNV